MSSKCACFRTVFSHFQYNLFRKQLRIVNTLLQNKVLFSDVTSFSLQRGHFVLTTPITRSCVPSFMPVFETFQGSWCSVGSLAGRRP